jgi:hypothetical protein
LHRPWTDLRRCAIDEDVVSVPITQDLTKVNALSVTISVVQQEPKLHQDVALAVGRFEPDQMWNKQAGERRRNECPRPDDVDSFNTFDLRQRRRRNPRPPPKIAHR